jgi:aryl-alcohol dehydrogenase-like predicted oxidoreductase
MRFLQAANADRPKMITIQNPYSLLCRPFEVGNAEICHYENVGLLAYSPLGFGVLTGKYIHETAAENARLKLFPRFNRYSSPQSTQATKRYMELAEAHGMNVTQMALAFVNDRPFVTSNIIGATNLEQLKENIDSAEVRLSKEVLKEIDRIHNAIPDPAV